MAEQETIELSTDAAVIYERDFVPALFDQWPPRLADAAAIGPGDRVLDVGCGTGVLAREAALRAGPTGKVTGLDVNESMLTVARRLRPEIEWRQGDATELPFADASFDVAASQFVLMFAADRTAMLAEMWRVLAPGGRLCVAVWAHSGVYATLAKIARRLAREEAAASFEAPMSLADEGGFLDLVGGAGITDARLETVDGQARFASIDEFIRIEIKGWVLADSLDGHAFDALAGEAREALKGYRETDGKMTFPWNAHIVTARKA